MVLVVGALVCLPLTPAQANYLSNADLKARLQAWHGDATVAYLKADGTEGSETDKDVTPVIKLNLSRGSCRMVTQDYATKEPLSALTIQVEVYASKEFKRSKYPTDYSTTWRPGVTWYTSGGFAVPPCDFWIRGSSGSGCYYSMADLQVGQWKTVKGHFEGLATDSNRAVGFYVPPGTGTVYLKNPTVEK